MISILIPYRGDGAHRDRVYDWVLRRWCLFFPDAEIIPSDAPGEGGVFSRARSINSAARKASGDVLIVADADTVVSLLPLRKALDEVHNEGWLLPYTRYYCLTEYATELQLGRPPAELLPHPETEFIFPSQHNPEPAVSGCVVVTRDLFEKIGGFDERFVGWGLEDRVFVMELQYAAGVKERSIGPAYHLWHPTIEAERFGQPFFERNRALYREKCALLGYQPIC